jgi:hypothetical protein
MKGEYAEGRRPSAHQAAQPHAEVWRATLKLNKLKAYKELYEALATAAHNHIRLIRWNNLSTKDNRNDGR